MRRPRSWASIEMLSTLRVIMALTVTLLTAALAAEADDDNAAAFIGIGMAYPHANKTGPTKAAFAEAKRLDASIFSARGRHGCRPAAPRADMTVRRALAATVSEPGADCPLGAKGLPILKSGLIPAGSRLR